MPKKAIFWDNDGVLVDTEPLYFEATRTVLAEAKIDLGREDFIRISLQQGRSVFDLARRRGHDEERCAAMRIERNRRYGTLLAERAGALPFVEETLRRLHGRVTMAIVTSSLKEHFDLIHERTGLLTYFDFVLTRQDYRQTKPHPEPYLTALKRSGLTGDDCLVVEDSERGLKSAHAAGLACAVIPNALTRGGDFTCAHAILNDIRDVPHLLAGN